MTAWGIKGRNNEQKAALAALLNPAVDLVILEGVAGSGKTLLALAAGLEQVMEHNRYTDIIFTRAPVGVGADMGFLPGTEEEKMAPYAGGLMDNLELLIDNKGKMSDVARTGTEVVLRRKIKVRAMQYMRGRSFNHRFIIVDETQNLSSQELKVLITRAGEGSKVVCMGDISQIDNKRLSREHNGLSHLIDAAKYTEVSYIKHVQLPESERSRLCSWGAEYL